MALYRPELSPEVVYCPLGRGSVVRMPGPGECFALSQTNINRLRPFAAARPAFLDGGDTPRAFLERCLEVIAARDGEVKAFVTLNTDQARTAADESAKRYAGNRPLSLVDGCPVAVKDIIDTADMATQMNSKVREGHRPKADASCVHALRRGGAIILGKTVTTEFACGVSGPTTNPYDAARTPGGSSSGSAASVGAGMAPIGLGTQTAGSVIRPASYNGTYAIKPSFGAINLGGVHPVCGTRDHLGVLGASLEDIWRAAHYISAIGGSAPGYAGIPGGAELPPARKPRRLALLRLGGWGETDEKSRAAFGELMGSLRAEGIELLEPERDTDLAALDAAALDVEAPARDIMCYEMRWPFQAYRDAGHELSKTITGYLDHAAEVTPAMYADALTRRDGLRARFAAYAGKTDAFVTLSSSGPAPLGHAFTGSRAFQTAWSVIGFPTISLPLLAVDGLPLGVQVMGFDGADDSLAAAARWIDEL